MSTQDQGWKSVSLPESLVAEVEELMNSKHEKRPVKVPLGLFIADMIRDSLEREESSRIHEPILEEYAVEPDVVYIRDNRKDVVAELRFKDRKDLFCNIDGAKNCVHVGFAWSIPKVNGMLKVKEKSPTNS
jgi:hypothetical protein